MELFKHIAYGFIVIILFWAAIEMGYSMGLADAECSL